MSLSLSASLCLTLSLSVFLSVSLSISLSLYTYLTVLYFDSGFPSVLGCIDGTFVRIQNPTEDEADFVNRKGYHALNVQVDTCKP